MDLPLTNRRKGRERERYRDIGDITNKCSGLRIFGIVMKVARIPNTQFLALYGELTMVAFTNNVSRTSCDPKS